MDMLGTVPGRQLGSFNWAPSLAPVPPLPTYGGKACHGLIPEEFFQFLYPKTSVPGPSVLRTGLSLYFLLKEIHVITPDTISAVSTIGGLTVLWPGKVTYRKRLHRVYKEAKNRLDCHISVQNTVRRKEQEHMARWVEKHVVPSIWAQQEKGRLPSALQF
ncbi:hypothetical protein QTO34_003921 [Cnephaeus nilssonii]|uniref:ATP synthase subunit b n=1 Tax=Cnephaeus nilssonii TaxID=3371016 RepID=A0AA40LJU5_CNENI|nr:hypothetical protein QTO34_003921 [Eptesicus nilssonii]